MRLRTVLVVVAIALLAAFAALNWSAFVAPTTLSLGYTVFEAPLGLLMLGVLMLLTLAFALYMAFWQAGMLLESRRLGKELQQQRSLADQAEASRFTELRTTLLAEFERLTGQLNQTQEALKAEMRDNTNALSAAIAEMDDRLSRASGPGSTP
ncbi:MAG: LapA family protein [Ramlibacter sp.]|nr:LapA family protein [Ramlibacter sp.]